MALGATPVLRGCGSRVAGGIYLETGLSKHGRPIEDFLIDPPTRLNADTRARMGITQVGVTPLPRQLEDGTTVVHVVDWVGAEYYPCVTDFVEEVRRFGLSRRVPRNFDFSLLTPQSRILLLHSRAWIGAADEYFARRQPDGQGWWCPQRRNEHVNPADPPSMCASLWWEDLPDGDPVPDSVVGATSALAPGYRERLVRRKMPSFEYCGFLQPKPLEDPRYDVAIFASFPLTRLAVVRDPEGGTHEQALDAARKAGLPVDEVEK